MQIRVTRQPATATTAPVSKPRSMPLMNAVLARWMSGAPVVPQARATAASAPPREFLAVAGSGRPDRAPVIWSW